MKEDSTKKQKQLPRTHVRLLTIMIAFTFLFTSGLFIVNDMDSSDATVTASGTCGDAVTWELENGTLTISGTGAMYNFSYFGEVPWYPYVNRITTVIIGNGVTSIGMSAFERCLLLSSITIPNSVKTIGGFSFFKCSSLSSIAIPDGVTSIGDYAFDNCTSLSTISIPNSVTSIGDSAFYVCVSLTAITVSGGNANYSSENGILFNKDKTTLLRYPAGKTDTSYTVPDSVTTLGNRAFERCSSLSSVSIHNGVTSIGSDVFEGCDSLTTITVSGGNANYSSENGVLFNKDKTTLLKYPAGKDDTSYTVPGSVTSIRVSAFSGCVSLSSVTIPNGVKSIGEFAFEDCVSLSSISLPDSITSIGIGAFGWCISLSSVTIPNGVTSIRESTFDGCRSLTSITIHDNIKSLPWPAFEGCTSLTEITVSGGNAYYCSENGVLFNKDKTTLLKYPAGKTDTSYTVPDSVTTIVDEAFEECTSLTEINVSGGNANYSSENGVLFDKDKTTLWKYPAGKNDTSYTVPDSIEIIEIYAFYGCASLSSVNIGDGTTIIGDYAFEGCTSLTSIAVSSDNANYKTVNGALYDKTGMSLICCPGGIESFTIPSEVTLILRGAFSGNIREITIPSSSSVYFDSIAISNCGKLEKIVIEDGAKATFGRNSMLYDDLDEHTIYIVAPDGFRLPDYATHGNVKIVYGEPPAGNSSLMIYVGIGVVAVLVVAGGIFFFVRKKV